MATRAHRLLAFEASDLPVVQYGGTTVRMAQFVAKAEQLASALPRAAYVINLAENRHHFLLGWVAATLREQVTLLPSGQTSDVLARVRREYPDHHTLDDAGIARLIASGSRPSTTPAASWEVPAERVVAFYNKRGTCEQWIKEGKGAIKWTRLSCRTFAANAVRLQLHALAYNLGNFLRTLATPEPIKDWSLTSLKEKLIKIGAKVVSHGRYVVFQMAEVAIPRQMFQEILRLIAELRPQPPPAPA